MDKIPFMRPNLVNKEAYISYLAEIDESHIYSNYGPLNSRFEKRVLFEYFGGQGSVLTVSNATIGLMLASQCLKRPTGKYVLMPSFTFPAAPQAAMWCGLVPYFVDVDPATWCIDEELLIDTVNKLGDEVALIMPYATFGNNISLNLYDHFIKSGIPVVIDAAASFGASHENRQFGQGFQGIVVYSLHATKTFGVGEGGLLYSGNEDLYWKLRQAANFGFYGTREAKILGLNGKISEYTAAIALATLDVYKEKIEERQRIYSWYLEQISRSGLLDSNWVLQEIKGTIPHQFLSILCPDGGSNLTVSKYMEDNGTQVASYFSPACHEQQIFRGFPKTKMDATDDLCRRVISLPLWEQMTQQQVKRVIELLLRS